MKTRLSTVTAVRLTIAAAVLSSSAALAQYTPPTTPPPAKPSQSTVPPKQAKSDAQTEVRPDAKYDKPSGQDARPSTTHVAKATPKQSTLENRGAKAEDQGKHLDKLAKQKNYTGAAGSKADPGTACSTARPTKDGGVDCGTTGNSATQGHIVTKPH